MALCAQKSYLWEHRLVSLVQRNRNSQGKGLCRQKPNSHWATAVKWNEVPGLILILCYCYQFHLHFPGYFLSFFLECKLHWRRTLCLIYQKESRIMCIKNWTCVIQSHSVISAFEHLQTWNRSITNITFLANQVWSLWQSLFFHITNAFCTYNTAPSTDYGSQVTDCSALALFVVKLSTWFLCSQHFLCQSLVVKATSLPLKYHGWKLVNKSDSWRIPYHICNMWNVKVSHWWPCDRYYAWKADTVVICHWTRDQRKHFRCYWNQAASLPWQYFFLFNTRNV